MAEKFDTVEDYLASLSDEVREPLAIALERVQHLVPEPGLVISYQIPTLTSGGRRVVHLAGWKSHLSLYPAPEDEALQAELAPYVAGKGTLKFELRKPIPYELIDRVVAALYAQQTR